MIVYEYVSPGGRHAAAEWGLEGRDQTRFEAELDRLEMQTLDSALGTILHGAGDKLLRMKIKGDRQLRPRFCRGPKDPRADVTFLLGVSKKQKRYTPAEPNNIALRRLDHLKNKNVAAKLSYLREG